MKFYRDLAKLRPGMPFSALSDIIGQDTKPPPKAPLKVCMELKVAIDASGNLGRLEFALPKSFVIEGFSRKMPLEAVLADPRFAPAGQDWLGAPIYAAKVTDTLEIQLRIDKKEPFIDRVDLINPNATYTYERLEGASSKFSGLNQVTLGDDNEMLTLWAEEAAPFGKSAGVKEYAHWLIHEATAIERHVAIVNWNWDCGHEPLIWAVHQPDCELATALTIFWLSNPYDYYAEVQGDRTKHDWLSFFYFDLIVDIRQRVLDGFYTRKTIAFDPSKAYGYLGDQYRKSFEGFDELFPPPLHQTILGIVIDEDKATEGYKNGFPPQFTIGRGGY